MANEKPKVSVCIITYNSSDTVVELLNSILLQSYGPENIELVISDDTSTDSTIKVIESWLNNHKAKFSNVILNINDENLGISKNFEKVLLLSTSNYIKSIAADDVLKIKALEIYMESISVTSSGIIFSRVERFSYKDGKKIILDIVPSSLQNINSFNNLNAKTQFDRLFLKRKEVSRQELFLCASSLFFKRSILKDILDAPKCRNLEDYPTWLFLLGVKNKQIKILKDILVEYNHGEGISFNYKKSLKNKIDILNDIIFIKKYFVKYLESKKRIKVYISIANLYYKLYVYKMKFFLKYILL
ncbi:glycosyltransferase family 2 protein [Candidatus Francisella endociliophora]|uniref:glycosyltransferase family 2 protein n=1 Tax=Candidatus Francisella endociliophora TaxID=653937 RepID=UPI00069401B2|nr:glycosyltransferase [Francisella sp. FSC1006]